MTSCSSRSPFAPSVGSPHPHRHPRSDSRRHPGAARRCPLHRRRPGVLGQVEGFNPGGIKDRPAMHMVARAKAWVICAPGPGSSSPAAAHRVWAWRWPAWCTGTRSPSSPTPAWSRSSARMLSAYGVQVAPVDEPHPDGGWRNRPAVTGWSACWPATPGRGIPRPATTPTTSRPIAGWPWRCTPNWPHRRAGVLVGTGGQFAGVMHLKLLRF